MDIKSSKAAILAQSREPLIVDEIEMPDQLEAGQVLVKVFHTTICGAQITEIAAAKGPDLFLPHLLGHEASAQVIAIGPGVAHVKPDDTGCIGDQVAAFRVAFRPTDGEGSISTPDG